jgi:hypothetical protein
MRAYAWVLGLLGAVLLSAPGTAAEGTAPESITLFTSSPAVSSTSTVTRWQNCSRSMWGSPSPTRRPRDPRRICFCSSSAKR